jgi:type IV pilus assembly protein PilE
MPCQPVGSGLRRHRGVTLIELLVAVMIVSILAAVAVPSYRSYVLRTHRAGAKAAMMDIASRQQQFLMSNRAYADTATLTAAGYAPDDSVTDRYTWAVTVNNAASPPSFSITFTATGAQASDGNLTLDSLGNRSPANKWDE